MTASSRSPGEMASGSKKVSNLPLSKEEQEEEELRNELINSGFFYDGIGIDEMKMILTELKKTKGIDSQNVEPVPAPSPIESNSTQNISQASESNPEKPLPSFSYRKAVTSGNLSIASTSNKDTFDNREKSPDPASNKAYGKNLSNEHNSHDNESVFEKNFNSNKDDYPQLGNKSNLKGNSCEYSLRLRPREAKKPTPAMMKKANLERWRIDPLQFLEDDDVPLKTPERSYKEEYLPYSNEEVDDETFDALCQQMSEKLDSLHQQIIARDSKTKWGSPIKVSGKRNGPGDKNSLMEKIPASSSHTADISVRDTFERSSKRKALNIITTATQNDSNDENSDEEYVNTKKRKCQQGKKAGVAPKQNQEDQENKNNISFEMIEVNQTDDFPNSEFDNSDLHTLNRNKKTTVSTNTNSIENESIYPRRITPPNRAKKSCKGPRYRQKSSIQSQTTSKKNSDFLNDNEISKIVNEPDEVDDNDCIEITHEIKPSFISKDLQKKLNTACNLLTNKRNANEQKIILEDKARKQKEIEDKLKKEELISKRRQEEVDKNNRQLEKQRKLNEQQLLYSNILSTQKRVTRSNFIPDSSPNYTEMNEDQLLASDDEITLTHSSIVTKNCPICQKPFPSDQIETHASECTLFTSESNDVHSFQPSTSYSRRDNIYECGICNKYTTPDGRRYEEHVTKCKENAEDQRVNGIYV